MKRFNLVLIISLYLSGTATILSCKSESARSTAPNDKLPYYQEATFTPIRLSSDAAALDTLHKVSPFRLINQDSQVITDQTFDNKIYVTNFFFTTCPGICPEMTNNMVDIQDLISGYDDVALLSHSVTPERDTVAALRAYAKEYGVLSDKWHLVTGDRQEIYQLGRKDYFVEEDLGMERDLDEFLHTENFVLVDKNKHIRGIYNGLNKSSLRLLMDDIHTLRKLQ